jgi:SAM-dependent methyltransferase
MDEYPEIVNYARCMPAGTLYFIHEDRELEEDSVWYADSTFFELFTHPFVYGQAEYALGRPNTMVVTESFARKHFGHLAEFTIQSITDLSQYPDNTFGLTVSSEVLEHIREYGKESQAISELERITRPGGIIVIGTPNSELIDDHGFDYYEMNSLLSDAFGRYCIFENALVPFGANRTLWEKRLAGNDTGIIVSQDINLSETVLPKNIKPELKQGIEAGTYQLGELVINTALLHNTHSWIGVAIKED